MTELTRTLTVVVMGVPAELKVVPDAPLSFVADRARYQTEHVDLKNGWEIREPDGTLLDPTLPVSVVEGTLLYMNPRAGVGGATVEAAGVQSSWRCSCGGIHDGAVHAPAHGCPKRPQTAVPEHEDGDRSVGMYLDGIADAMAEGKVNPLDVELMRYAGLRLRYLAWERAQPVEDAVRAAFAAVLPADTPATDGHRARGLTPEMVEEHYPHSQHQPDECELCRAIHDIAKEALAANA